MKAKSLGIPVEDYFNDKVPTFDLFDQAQPTFEGIDAELINRLYDNEQGISLDELDFGSKIQPNECFVLKSDPVSYTHLDVYKRQSYTAWRRVAQRSIWTFLCTVPSACRLSTTIIVRTLRQSSWRG